MTTPQIPASLLTQIVASIAELVTLGTGQLPEGARCIVQEGTGTLPDQRNYIYTKKAPTASITFTNGIAPNDNVVQAADGGGLWVCEVQLVNLTLNETTPVVVGDLYCFSSDSSQDGCLVFFNRVGSITGGTSVAINFADGATISAVSVATDTSPIIIGIRASI